MIDTINVLYHYLVNNTTITTEVGSNVYGPPGLPRNFSITKALVFWGDGGGLDVNIPRAVERVAFRCYGTTAKEARAVYNALVDALHRQRADVTIGSTTYRILYAEQSGGPFDMVEPEFGWPFVQVYYNIQFVWFSV